jgi:hypothetical protein
MITIEAVLAFMWLALTLRNTAALLPLFILLADIVFINIFSDRFPRYCLTAMIYLSAAQTNINISAKLRYAFLMSASLFWVSAIDEMLYNQVDTYYGHFYAVMPYLVIALNAYIAAVLLSDGGRGIVGTISGLRSSVINRIARL